VAKIPDLDFSFDATTNSKVDHPHGYIYTNTTLPTNVIWTLGVSADHYDETNLTVDKVNPKFGVQWNVTNAIVLRGAVFQIVKPSLVSDQTLEPTQVAGFNQMFDDINATTSLRYGVGADWTILDNLFAGGEATWRDLSVPVFTDDSTTNEHQNEQNDRIYVHWLPVPELALSADVVFDRFKSEDGTLTDVLGDPTDVKTFSVPIGARYFHPSGFFAGLTTAYVHQDVDRSQAFGGPQGDDDFFVVDASIGYRLPKRSGIASLSVSNIFDQGFHYQDDSFREFQNAPSVGPYIPERQIVARLTLNF
jgi:hypothetical protein